MDEEDSATEGMMPQIFLSNRPVTQQAINGLFRPRTKTAEQKQQEERQLACPQRPRGNRSKPSSKTQARPPPARLRRNRQGTEGLSPSENSRQQKPKATATNHPHQGDDLQSSLVVEDDDAPPLGERLSRPRRLGDIFDPPHPEVRGRRSHDARSSRSAALPAKGPSKTDQQNNKRAASSQRYKKRQK